MNKLQQKDHKIFWEKVYTSLILYMCSNKESVLSAEIFSFITETVKPF